jgi:hypothetical protein
MDVGTFGVTKTNKTIITVLFNRAQILENI